MYLLLSPKIDLCPRLQAFACTRTTAVRLVLYLLLLCTITQSRHILQYAVPSHPVKTLSPSEATPRRRRYRFSFSRRFPFVVRHTPSVCQLEGSSCDHGQRVLPPQDEPSRCIKRYDSRRVRLGEPASHMPVDSSPALSFRGCVGEDQRHVLV